MRYRKEIPGAGAGIFDRFPSAHRFRYKRRSTTNTRTPGRKPAWIRNCLFTGVPIYI